MRFFLQEEVHDLADENDGHADGGDELEAEVEEAVAPELVAAGLALRHDQVFRLPLPAYEQGHHQRAERHQYALGDDVEEVEPAVDEHRDLARHQLVDAHAEEGVRSGNRTCYTGHAAAYGVERDGQADDEREDGRNAHDLGAVGGLALLAVGVDAPGDDGLEQGDGRGDRRDEHEEVEHESDEAAKAAHAQEDVLHGVEQQAGTLVLLHAEGRAGRENSAGCHDGYQSITGRDYERVLLQVLLLIQVGAVGDYGAHAKRQ